MTKVSETNKKEASNTGTCVPFSITFGLTSDTSVASVIEVTDEKGPDFDSRAEASAVKTMCSCTCYCCL